MKVAVDTVDPTVCAPATSGDIAATLARPNALIFTRVVSNDNVRLVCDCCRHIPAEASHADPAPEVKLTLVSSKENVTLRWPRKPDELACPSVAVIVVFEHSTTMEHPIKETKASLTFTRPFITAMPLASVEVWPKRATVEEVTATDKLETWRRPVVSPTPAAANHATWAAPPSEKK